MTSRLLLWTACMLAGLGTATAQTQEVQPLTLHPAAEPDPALRYVFWPAPETRMEANPAPFVSRAVILLLEKAPAPEQRSEYQEKRAQWQEMPINELPLAEIKQYLARHADPALAELERAAPLMNIDYDLRLSELSVTEMVATVLPEIQSMRELARMLNLRARVAVAEKRWDDFVRDVRVGMRLGEVAGSSNDLLVSRLVGFAITATMLAVVQDAMEQPDCPNLYWALAAIPDRLFEIRDAMEFESVLLANLISASSELPAEPIGPVRARELIRNLADQAMSLGFAPADKAARDLMMGAAVVSLAEPSRELLNETTEWAGRADELSAAEAVLRATVLKLQRSRHQWLKWTLLPDELWKRYGERVEVDLKSANGADIFVILANQLVPAVRAAMDASQRTAQRRNLLITIEALRMHASQTNELPESIESLEPVPAWHDPLANGAFVYERQSATVARLRTAPRQSSGETLAFEISLQVPAHSPATESSK